MSEPYKIGILGSGSAGRTLGRGLLGLGHPVMIGSRNPAKLDAWLQDAGPAASAGTFADAACFGDVVILSVRGSAAENVLESAGLDSFDAKVLIDASDP